jgi:hypothetical protein
LVLLKGSLRLELDCRVGYRFLAMTAGGGVITSEARQSSFRRVRRAHHSTLIGAHGAPYRVALAVIASDSAATQKRGVERSDLFDGGCWIAAPAIASSQ